MFGQHFKTIKRTTKAKNVDNATNKIDRSEIRKPKHGLLSILTYYPRKEPDKSFGESS